MKIRADFEAYLNSLLERERELSAEWKQWHEAWPSVRGTAVKPAKSDQPRRRANHIVEESFGQKE